MDSRLIAGAYSQHFRALEEEQLQNSTRNESTLRAKRLSHETNRRRKFQAQKRKLEAQREEKRRHDILSKRREEQKQATEKYQRSHIPTSARQGSGRLSPRRHGGTALEDALRLIRGGSRHYRPRSAYEKTTSPDSENQDPLDKCYIDQSHHIYMSRPSSGRASNLTNPNMTSELHDYSMQNLTSSKTLFEQHLEQQQNLILEQQQQSLRDFNNAVQREIDSDQIQPQVHDLAEDIDKENNVLDVSSDSSCSIDSLEGSKGNEQNQSQFASNTSYSTNGKLEIVGENVLHSQEQDLFNNTSESKSMGHVPLNQDMTASALYQTNVPVTSNQGTSVPKGLSYVGVTREDILKNQTKDSTAPQKTVSQDAFMESGSSSSSLSILKLPENPQKDNLPSSQAPTLEKDEIETETIAPQQIVVKSGKIVEGSTVQGINDTLSIDGQVAWEPSAPQLDMSSLAQTVNLDYNPRYASAIGLSLWPSSISQFGASNPSNMMNNQPFTQDIFTSVSLPASHPIFANTNTGSYSSATLPSTNIYSTGLMDYTTSTSSVSNKNVNQNDSNFADFNKQDFSYPAVHNYLQTSTVNTTLPQSTISIANTMDPSLQQQVDIQASLADMAKFNSSGIQSYQQLNSYQQRLANNVPHVPTIYGQDLSSQPTASAPVPAVRSAHLNVRPSVPTSMGVAPHVHHGRAHSAPVSKTTPSREQFPQTESKTTDDILEDDDVEEEVEEQLPLRGILKTAAPKMIGQKGSRGKNFPRDSLELARMHSESKLKKKSVRFGDAHIEEFDENEMLEETPKAVTVSMNKPSVTRPVSAKVPSTVQRPGDPVKIMRAASAGTVRHPPTNTTMTTKASTAATPTTVLSSAADTKESNGSAFNQRSNLPPSVPLNTSPINRPKAAAHIIMSSDYASHPHSANTGHPHNANAASTAAVAHKSHLDSKVKTVSNNFMSKVPVKMSTPNTNTNAMVYHVSRSNAPDANTGLKQNGIETDHTSKDVNNQQLMQDRSKMVGNKRVPISNASISKTTVVSTTDKISMPQSNSGGVPSYANDSEANIPVYDENGLRIDRTPTDEEITWLWDKVRNCLQKEEDKNANNKTVNMEPRPAPVLSTKIIDGASLGLGPNMTGTRTSSGYFYTRTSSAPSSQQSNKAKPALQPPGSYLRRYGLLKQRRVQSANPLGSNQQPSMTQRASSALLTRQNSQPTIINQQFHLGQQDNPPPTPIAFSYKPQDNVSESTAAFMMAERLAKQSLSDSHIQAAMEDAQGKQEVYNKVRTVGNRGGQSALSIEEQKLMESLDKLNERLKVNDVKFNGTIHYHQGYQPHLPGFRGHHTLSDHRQSMSPRSQQRAQSARIRMQTRRYR